MHQSILTKTITTISYNTHVMHVAVYNQASQKKPSKASQLPHQNYDFAGLLHFE